MRYGKTGTTVIPAEFALKSENELTKPLIRGFDTDTANSRVFSVLPG